MCKCSLCGKEYSGFILNNKQTCLHCDELLFDLEIECDEEKRVRKLDSQISKAGRANPTPH